MPMYGPMQEEDQKRIEGLLQQLRGTAIGGAPESTMTEPATLDQIVPRRTRPDYDAAIRAAQNSTPNLGEVIGAGFAGFGQSIAGGGNYLDNTLKGIDAGRARRVESATLDKTLGEDAEEKDPESPISKQFQSLATKLTGKPVEGLSAYDLKKTVPLLEKMYDMEIRAQDRADRRDFQEKSLAAQTANAEATRNLSREKFATEREAKQAEIAKGKMIPANTVVNVNEGAAAARKLPDIEKLIDNNPNLFGPIMGRARALNPYDKDAASVNAEMRAASQQFGRYMEGGVLRKEDEEKYRRMFPQSGDTPEVAKNKLNSVKRLLSLKYNSDIKTLGDSGYDVSGFDVLSSTESLAEHMGKGGNGGLTEDDEALQWAQENPDDPRAQEILQMQGR